MKAAIFIILISLMLIFGCTQQQAKQEIGKENNKSISNVSNQSLNQTINQSQQETGQKEQVSGENLTEEELNDLFNTDIDKAIEEINITG
ncbi:MAG: hypothetical protein QXS91_00690 [Candidatus Anstonellales archaeon]